MSFNLSYLLDSLAYGSRYIHISLLLAFVPLVVGTLFGTAIALVRLFKLPVLSRFFDIFIPIYNGIPGIVTLFIYNLLYLLYCKPSAAGVINVAFFTFCVGYTMRLSETVRGAFLSVPRGQYEACYAVGLTVFQTLRRVVIPQVVPVAIPAYTNMTVGAIKNSSLVIAIGVTEVMNGATIPCANTYSFLEGYVAAAIIYWGLNIVAENLFKLAEKHFLKYKAGKADD